MQPTREELRQAFAQIRAARFVQFPRGGIGATRIDTIEKKAVPRSR